MLELNSLEVILVCLSRHVVLESGKGHMQVNRWLCVEDVKPRNSSVAVQNAVGCLITSFSRPPSRAARFRDGVKI